MQAVSAALVPSLTDVLENMLMPLNEKLDQQSKGIATLNNKIDAPKQVSEKLKIENRRLRNELNEADERIDLLESRLDNLEQYGRRNSCSRLYILGPRCNSCKIP